MLGDIFRLRLSGGKSSDLRVTHYLAFYEYRVSDICQSGMYLLIRDKKGSSVSSISVAGQL